MRNKPSRVLLLAFAVTVLAVGCSSGSTGGAQAVSTTVVSTSTTTPRPTPTEISGTLLTGDVAFLGPIYTVPVGGLTMAFRQLGSGPDLLLIAGQASPMSVWPVSTLAALAAQHRVTIYDNRDLGDTADTTKAFTIADLADDAAKLIAALGLHRPAVFGWSTGGEIGLLLAVRHPDVLSALAITGATPGGPKSVLPPPDIVKLFADPNPDASKLLDVLFSPSGDDAKSRFIADFAKVPQPASSPNAAERYDAAEHDYWAEPEPNLEAITVPVLVMNGEDDYAVPPANATYIAERIGKNTRLELDAGGRHGWFIEHPGHFQSLIGNFLG
jgi:pimeloyl-ACP methyl ester carboxylesterase